MKVYFRISALLLLSGFLLASVSGCKKSPNDPALSLRTRKARVVGEWKAESGKIEVGDETGFVKYTVSGSNYKAEDNFGNYGTGTALVSFTFERKGDCKGFISFSGFVNKFSGQWNFTSGVGEKKNKTQIVVHATSVDDGAQYVALTGNDHDFTYDIDELRHKKLVIKLTDDVSYSDGTFRNYREEWVLIPK